MTSETPRTDKLRHSLQEASCESPTSPLKDALMSCEMFERELNGFIREMGEENVVSAMVRLLEMKRELAAKEAELAQYKAAVGDEAALWANHLRGTIKLPIDRMREEIERPLRAELEKERAKVARLREEIQEMINRLNGAICLNPMQSSQVYWNGANNAYGVAVTQLKELLASLDPQSERDAAVLRAAEEHYQLQKERMKKGHDRCDCDICQAVRGDKKVNTSE